MINFPIFIKLQDQHCLVVGGGVVATRKIKQLLIAGAKVFVVAPNIEPALEKLKESGDIRYFQQAYTEKCLEGKQLVIAATNDKQLNNQIAKRAKSQNILVNVVDDYDAGTFIMPSIINRNPVVIAISTSGIAPVLTKLLSIRIETLIPSNYGKLASLISRFRDSA